LGKKPNLKSHPRRLKQPAPDAVREPEHA
jgi:hypothetical protein